MKNLAAVALLLTLIAAPARTQVGPAPPGATDVGLDSNMNVFFDWGGKSSDGSDHAPRIRTVLFGMKKVAGGREFTKSCDIPVVAGETKFPVREVIAGLSVGEYQLGMKLIDVAGQESAFSMPILINVRAKKPAPPTNVRVGGG